MTEIDLERPVSNRITIGIPCYRDCPAETMRDYMGLAYYLGRRYPEWDFFLSIRDKAEQFRARNNLVRDALQVDSKYLLMLDDDHVIDFESENIARFAPVKRYEFLRTLINHMEADPKLGVVGALYFHRGGEARPVVMKEGQDGGFYWMLDSEIEGKLQEVAVTGGGCMLLRCEALLKIPEPLFEPEFELGTDLQICKKLREAGYRVACDTSIEIGHVKSSREIITSANRHRTWASTLSRAGKKFTLQEGLKQDLCNDMAYSLYRDDVMEFAGISEFDMPYFTHVYAQSMEKFKEFEDPKDYYASLGVEQVIRNCAYQYTGGKREQNEIILDLIDTNQPGYGLDFGCGTSMVGFELAMRGHRLDFVDVPGAPSYDFVKWRVEKRGIGDRCGFELKGPYDYILLLDVVEHLKDWREELLKLTTLLKQNGAIFCNFHLLNDFDNVEHIMMDKDAVQKFFTEQGIYPINQLMWLKYDLSKVGMRKRASDAA